MPLRAPETDAYSGVTRRRLQKFRDGSLFRDAPWRAFVVGGQRVLNDARSHFLHGDSLELMRNMGGHRTLEPWQGAATELLGALRRNVDKEKPTRDRRRSFNLGTFGGSSVLLILLHHGL